MTTLTPECSVGTRAGRWECSMAVLGKAFQGNGLVVKPKGTPDPKA